MKPRNDTEDGKKTTNTINNFTISQFLIELVQPHTTVLKWLSDELRNNEQFQWKKKHHILQS